MGPVTGTNLILQSEDLSTTWTQTRSSINANAIASPDGLTTADTLVEDTTASNNHFTNQQFTLDADKIYVYSFYAKAISGATNRNITVQVQTKANTFPGFVFKPYNLTANNPFNNGISRGIQDVGNGWVRGHLVFDSQSGATSGQLYAILHNETAQAVSYTGDGSSGMHLWGFQLEQAPTLITDAEDFSANWTTTNVTVTTNQIAAPDGNTTADLMAENSSNSAHRINLNVAVEGNKPYTFSVFVKANTFADGRVVGLVHSNASSIFDFTQTDFNLTDGTINFSTHESASITDVGNGWFRLVATETSVNSGTGNFRILFRKDGNNSYQGDGSSGVYLWGAQVEEGASATPYPPEPTKYLPTYASTNLPFVGYNHNQGTIDTRFTMLGLQDFKRIYGFSNSDNSDKISILTFVSGNGVYEVVSDEGTNTVTTDYLRAKENESEVNHVFGYKTDNVRVERKNSLGAVDSYSDTSVTIPDEIDRLGLGVRPDSNGNVGSFIMKRFHYYASRLKNDFLKRLR